MNTETQEVDIEDNLPEEMTTKEYLMNIPVPEQTSTYKPVSHSELITVTLSSLFECGFDLVKEIYTYSKDGLRANGKYLLKYGNDPDMSLMIAWQNSYDKSLSLKFAVGVYVFICENGCVSGDFGAFKSKHIGDVQQLTPATLKEYICNAGVAFDRMVIEKEKMKLKPLTMRQYAEVLGRLFIEKKLITSTQLNVVKAEMEQPTYDYNCPNSVWELYNYVTFSLKSISPEKWMWRQIECHKFFVAECLNTDNESK